MYGNTFQTFLQYLSCYLSSINVSRHARFDASWFHKRHLTLSGALATNRTLSAPVIAMLAVWWARQWMKLIFWPKVKCGFFWQPLCYQQSLSQNLLIMHWISHQQRLEASTHKKELEDERHQKQLSSKICMTCCDDSLATVPSKRYRHRQLLFCVYASK